MELKQSALDKIQQETVHEARLAIKKMNALLALTKNIVPDTFYRRTKQQLETIKDNLGPTRDSIVVGETLENFVVLHPHLQNNSQQLRIILAKNKSRIPSYPQKSLAKTQDLLNTMLACYEQISISHPQDLISRLKKSYLRIEKTLQLAKTKGKNNHFHELRKKTKTLLYQLRFLEPLWPKNFNLKIKKLNKIQNKLGLDHDWVVTKKFIQDNLNSFKKTSFIKQLFKYLKSDQKRIRKKCLRRTKKIIPKLSDIYSKKHLVNN